MPATSKKRLLLAAVGTMGMAAYLAVQWLTPPQVRPRGTAELVDQLRDPRSEARREATAALAEMGPGAIAALEPLLDTLTDGDPLVRATAATALGRLGPPALTRLIAMLDGRDVRIRRGAIQALGV